MTTINDITLFEFKSYEENDGLLIPIEAMNDIPISIRRVFFVLNAAGAWRGNHAHINSRQVLSCPTGKLTVCCDDGINKKKFILDKPNLALYIPEMIWDSTFYEDQSTMLLVCSNTLYDPKDYINDYDLFVKLKNNNRNFNISQVD